MQYYRLWIYSCNVVLGLTSAIFIIFAAFVVADVRLSLLEEVNFWHPTFLYAYGALILQCGVVQTIGCLGAKRLSHKLLSLYWTLLLLLTLGDIGVGLYWVFHLEKVKINLRPYLTKEFMQKYSTDEAFTLKWNKIQSQDQCCGVDGPLDFEGFSTSQLHHSQQAAHSSNSHIVVGVESGLLSLPESCCTLFYVPPTLSSSSNGGSSLDKTYRVSNYPPEEEHPPFNGYPSEPSTSSLPNDELRYHSSHSTGSRRRSRTTINLGNRRLKSGSNSTEKENDEDEEEEDDDEEEEDENEELHSEYLETSSSQDEPLENPLEQIVVVPEIKVSEATRWNTTVQNRDIKTYEPIHVHKIRHELHRKSQSQIYLKPVNITTSSLALENGTNELNQTFEKVNSVKANLFPNRNDHNKSRDNHNRDPNLTETIPESQSDLIGLGNEEIFNPYVQHRHTSQKKASKLFPSISYEGKQRKRREKRALSVTQAVRSPIHKNPIVCQEQPQGLNHHNSYKNFLPDQRKASQDRQDANALLNSKKLNANWLYRITSIASKPTSAIDNKNSGFLQGKQAEFTSAGITKRKATNEIGNITNTKNGKDLVAEKKSQRIMTTSTISSSLHTFTKIPLSPNKSGTLTNSKDRRFRNRQIRSVQIGIKRSNPDSLKISAFTKQKNDGAGRQVVMSSHPESDSVFDPPRVLPLSSVSDSHSEAHYSHSDIMSTSALTNEDHNNSGNNHGNSSDEDDDDDDVQKTLYVYGVGCGVKLTEWVDHVSGILFILGFCIICFVKTCFLVILRTEIREMIEKIHMIEPEEVKSPSRTQKDPKFHHVSHPLLQNPHRSSTVSAHGLLPTIKSPDGPSSLMTVGMVGGFNNRPNRHYLRRASNIVGGDRSRSHSNETVNMTLLMATSVSNNETGDRGKLRSNPNLSSAGGSSGTIANLEERDPVSGLSITVPSGGSTGYAPVGAARYLRRSSTCSSSTNQYGYPYGCGFDGEPRAGPSRFYQYFEPLYQPPHLYQQHHHHHYARNRSHSRNMSCGAILPLTSYRANSIVSAVAAHRAARNVSNATTNVATGGYGFNTSTSKDENELVVSVSLEHIQSSDQDEEEETPVASTLPKNEEEKDQEKKDFAAATSCLDPLNEESSKTDDDNIGTKLQTFTESANETINSSDEGSMDRELQRRNGNNNFDPTTSLPMAYIGTPV